MVSQTKGEWLKNRVQSMGPAEMISRVADVGRHLALCAYRKNVQKGADSRLTAFSASDQFPDISKQLNQVPPRSRDAVIAAANGSLQHRANFFSLVDMPLGERIDWHRDYSSDTVGPMTYSGFINTRDSSASGNIRYIWELNRLQHLIPLALAWRWTGNADYWRVIENQIVSWDRSNPFMTGVNWKSPLEAGIRLMTWAYVALVMAGLRQSRDLYDKVLQRQIYQHQYFIRKFYSKHSSANNHLVGEMAGLYIGSVVWPWYKESTSWRTFSKQKLIQEIDRQIEPDGVAKERATEYQLFDLELFLAAAALGQAIGDPFPHAYWDRISRMIAFLSAISSRAGDVPLFGDGDNAHVIPLPETSAQRLGALISLGNFSEMAEAQSLRSLLLLWGQAPTEIPLSRFGNSKRNIQAFADGGYYVMASDRGSEEEILIVFDSGPMGLPPLNAHGHADALSFCLTYGGREFLIDPGTYCYQGMTEWRGYFRGTGAHNTVRVDGEDQSITGGPFLWRQTANARLENVVETAEVLEVRGSHDGYLRLQDPVIHTRSLQFSKKSRELLISDHLDCRESHHIELLFHFSERCRLEQTGPKSFEASNGGKRLALRIDSQLRTELYRGSENPIFGWVSRRFGVKEPAFTLVARADIAGPAQFLTEISAL
jgi:uncharacterized heparinase superfamily protein